MMGVPENEPVPPSGTREAAEPQLESIYVGGSHRRVGDHHGLKDTKSWGLKR